MKGEANVAGMAGKNGKKRKNGKPRKHGTKRKAADDAREITPPTEPMQGKKGEDGNPPPEVAPPAAGNDAVETPAPTEPTAPVADTPPVPDPTLLALRALRARTPRGRDPLVRQGGELVRATSPAWELTTLRIRRVAMRRFERFRALLALNERVPPHWQAFEALLDELEQSLPRELRPLVAEPD